MNATEFQAQSREVLERTLNQLQSATLLIAQLESQVSEAGRAVQGLSQMIEQYVRNTASESDVTAPMALERTDIDTETDT
jgi:hypothetical protein